MACLKFAKFDLSSRMIAPNLLMEIRKLTEEPSHYRHLDKMTVNEILLNINKEDKTVPMAVEKALPQIEKLVHAIVDKMLAGGRMFYIGAGTSGRLGIVDASECPPTYGVPSGLVVGIIAGGDEAIRKAAEHAEDDPEQGWSDLQHHKISNRDVLIGIAASGSTPYVQGALLHAREQGIITGCICCNSGSPMAAEADYPVEVLVGPEFVTGSTRMKSGTAQKLVLNMISTALMIQLGRVDDNRMVNMQLTSNKLINRGTRMIMAQLGIAEYDKAKQLLRKYGSVKQAVVAHKNK
jgi:N-acetylmuramic acid 6-phosphate etherase